MALFEKIFSTLIMGAILYIAVSSSGETNRVLNGLSQGYENLLSAIQGR